MLSRRQIAAEDDGVCALLDQRRKRIDEGRELWVSLVDQLFRSDEESQEGWIRGKAGTRLDIDRIFVIGVFVKDLRLKSIALVGHPVAKGAESGRWGRTDTAHQG